MTSTHRQRSWYNPIAIVRSIALRPRFYMALLLGTAAFFALPKELSGHVREACAWIVGGLIYLLFAFAAMRASPPDVIAVRAARQDDSRLVILALILIAILSSFASIAGLLNEAKEATRAVKWAFLALAATTLVLSWTVTQVVFTLHYAHTYYRPDHGTSDGSPGLDFPGEKTPDYWDFLYFATSIGATSQTSDVSIRSRVLRRLVTVHAVVSFFFNATVLALMINLAASMI